MADISKDEVKRVAKLARLGITDAEAEQAASDLAGVLEHFSKIQHVDTEGVPMATDTSGVKNVAREDMAADEVLARHDQLLEAAPDTKDRQLKVKAVFD